MNKSYKLLLKILSGEGYNNINFSEICKLLGDLGFKERIKGSHHIFYKENIDEIINIQPDGKKAKSYQIKQIRDIIINYKLGGLLNG